MDDDIVLEEGEEGEKNASEKLSRVKRELVQAKKERDENLAGWQRAKADYINLERRLREVRESSERDAAKRLVEGFVTAFDAFDAGSKALEGHKEVSDHLKMVSKQFNDALKNAGIERFAPEAGDSFDPLRHEPVQTLATEDEKADNTISECLQSGYAFGEHVIRPARVSVFRFDS